MTLYKYHGAGNDFLIADGRDAAVELTAEQISAICDRHTGIGADGVMVLERSVCRNFRMRYYNSDGSGGMMCGNGGRCIVAFAADLGYGHFSFEAPDGPHEAELAGGASEQFSHSPRIIRLKMKDVHGAVNYPAFSGRSDWFLDTGTRHLVRFVDDVEACDVTGEGRIFRHDGRFAPVGVNVNFVSIDKHEGDAFSISVRTFEKGVEDETLACGTGIVASSMATWLESRAYGCGQPVRVDVRARISELSVSFVPSFADASSSPASFRAENVWLEGPAAYIGKIII